MRVKWFSIFLMLCLTLLPVSQISAQSTDNARVIKEFEILYQKGLEREKQRIFGSALVAYKTGLTRAQQLLSDKNTSPELIREIIPYALASAYRKGIVTHRSIEGSLVKLYTQLELYEEAEKWITETLTMLSNLEATRTIKTSERQTALLYFARAYNQSGLAFALLKGSLWKRYLVYPPADDMKILDEVIKDLQQTIDFSLGSEPTFQNIAVSPDEIETWRLSLGIPRPEEVLPTVQDILDNSIKKTIELYNSSSVTEGITVGRKIFTYEELTKDSSAAVFDAISKILASIEVKPTGNPKPITN